MLRNTLLFLATFATLNTCHAVLVDGYCYLGGQTNHEGTKVLFQADSPSAVTDSTYTNSSGYYQIDLSAGVYDVYFSHHGFQSNRMLDQLLFTSCTMPEMILIVNPFSGQLSGTLPGDTTYSVVGDIWVAEGDSLIIEAGAVLVFNSGVQFDIFGYLHAAGTETDSILLVNQSGWTWGGIDFNDSASDSSKLEFCYISGSSSSGIYCESSNPSISNCTIIGNTAIYGGGISCDDSSNPSISNCTITGNTAIYGSGISCSFYSSPSISGNTISGNTATGSGNHSGGGIYCSSSNPIISDNTISENTAAGFYGGCGYGGGIYCISSNPIISGNTIRRNTATGNFNNSGYGGGIYCSSSSPTISGNAISENTATCNSDLAYGGGIYCGSSSNPIISDNTINGNTATSTYDYNSGGGIYCSSSSPSIINCIISSNATSLYGGGISFSNSISPSIINCTISNNTAHYGSGIYCSSSSPSIRNCTITENTAHYDGSGIYCYNSATLSINNCIINNNTAASNGSGIYCSSSSPSIRNCTITENTAHYDGSGIYCYNSATLSINNCIINNNTAASNGGGIYCYSSNPSIRNCTFTENTANYGGGIYCYNSTNLSINNCTISRNTASSSGGGISCSSSSPSIMNTIVANNQGSYGIFIDSSHNIGISYSDFYNNEVGNFYNPPPWVGTIVTTNINGDSCDAFFNIFEEPLFVDPIGGDYHLLPDSPCVDAGDPSSPLDPDNTIADIGAFYYNQNHPNISVFLIALNPPIIIPYSGGSFEYTIEIENTSDSTVFFDAWIDATLPSGAHYGPEILRTDIEIGPFGTLFRQMTQNVGPGAPAGEYSYNAYVGVYPTEIWSQDSFPFTKEGNGSEIGGMSLSDWQLSGWEDPVTSQIAEMILPETFSISAYPNPFNPTTALSYQLQAPSLVNLSVYDIEGRKVAELVNGWRDAGAHEVTFDGSGLASGVYIYRLELSGSGVTPTTMSGKMVLIK